MSNFIVITNARLHNLKNITVRIPVGRITLVSGVSGSGKSTLAVDILGKVSRQKYFDFLGETFRGAGSPVLEEEESVDLIDPFCPAVIFRGHVVQRNPQSTVGTVSGLNRLIKSLFSFGGRYLCPGCGRTVRTSEPEEIASFLLNSASGKRVILKAPVHLPTSVDQRRMVLYGLRGAGFLRLDVGGRTFLLDDELNEALQAVGRGNVDVTLVIDRLRPDTGKIQRLFDSIRTALQVGHGKVTCDIEMERGRFEAFNFSTILSCDYCGKSFLDPLEKKNRISKNDTKTSAKEASLTFYGRELADILDVPLSEVFQFFLMVQKEELVNPQNVLHPLLQKITSHLKAAEKLGIGHLELSRSVTDISTGEFLKLRLCSLVAQKFVGVLFILDEPVSILPARERAKVCELIINLKEAGNTVLMVDHASEAVEIADYFIEIGPEGGERGGRLICQKWLDSGGRAKVISELESIPNGVKIKTKATTEEKLAIPLSSYFQPKQDLKIIKGGFNLITGPTGSGKTILIHEIKEWLVGELKDQAHVFEVPQMSIFKSRYSMPATILSVFGRIRTLFAKTRKARGYGLSAGLFSLSKKGGRCEMCKGTGVVEKEGFGCFVSYLCPLCKGRRYNSSILDVRYRGLTISEILKLSITEAADFFSNIAAIRIPLEISERVGIGYLGLGQPVCSLSTGEAQRLKIAAHLVRNGACGKAGFYLLDQPTAGLHPRDVWPLADFFRELLISFNATLIVADNNNALLYQADQVIKLRGDGSEGEKIVYHGT